VVIRRGLTQEGEGSNVGVGSSSPPSKGHNISKAITKIVLGNNHARLKSYIKYLFIYFEVLVPATNINHAKLVYLISQYLNSFLILLILSLNQAKLGSRLVLDF
jgi:hypothetical protein